MKKARYIVSAAAVLLASAALCFADDPQMGTWKLNEAKSKIAAGMPKNTTVVYAPAGDNVKITVDGTGANGQTSHHEWTGKFDARDYPVTGDPGSDARSYKKVDDRTLEITNKKGDKVTITGRAVVSADGKSRTVTLTGTDAKGNKITSTQVYDKQ